MPPEPGGKVKCRRCGRSVTRLVRCGVCDDRVCVEQCMITEEQACRNCVTLGVSSPDSERESSDE